MNAIEQAIEALDHILKMQIRGFIVIGDKATSQAREAITAMQSMQGEAAQERLLARNQPCGCVVCYCENEDQCQGCGAKNCGTHPVGEMPSPVYTHPQSPLVPEAHNIKSAELYGDQSVIVKFPSCRAANAFRLAMLTASGKGE